MQEAVLNESKSTVLSLSRHAQARCQQRNIDGAMITNMFPLLLEFGSWNKREDRMTLKTGGKEFQLLIREIKRSMLKIKYRVQNLKSINSAMELITENKKQLKALKRYLKNILRLEHKDNLTLVLKAGTVITAYIKTVRNKNKTTEIYHKWVPLNWMKANS